MPFREGLCTQQARSDLLLLLRAKARKYAGASPGRSLRGQMRRSRNGWWGDLRWFAQGPFRVTLREPKRMPFSRGPVHPTGLKRSPPAPAGRSEEVRGSFAGEIASRPNAPLAKWMVGRSRVVHAGSTSCDPTRTQNGMAGLASRKGMSISRGSVHPTGPKRSPLAPAGRSEEVRVRRGDRFAAKCAARELGRPMAKGRCNTK